jgi:hypothetical protein
VRANLWIGAISGMFVALMSACSREGSPTDSAIESGCPRPANVVLSSAQVDAAIAGIKGLASGVLSFQADPAVVEILTSSTRTADIVASLMCTAEKREEISAKDAPHLEYTRKLFMYMWGTSPSPKPEDVQEWTRTHPYSSRVVAAPSSKDPLHFTREGLNDIAPGSDTCTKRPIPAGVAACVHMQGSWSDGLGPLGNRDPKDPRGIGSGAMSIYATEAKDVDLVLTSSHPYEHSNWLKQNVDYLVCVRSPDGVQRNPRVQDQISVDVDSRPRNDCLPVDERAGAARQNR